MGVRWGGWAGTPEAGAAEQSRGNQLGGPLPGRKGAAGTRALTPRMFVCAAYTVCWPLTPQLEAGPICLDQPWD